jgi:hypothetical protein
MQGCRPAEHQWIPDQTAAGSYGMNMTGSTGASLPMRINGGRGGSNEVGVVLDDDK